jgi:hypothetical protein
MNDMTVKATTATLSFSVLQLLISLHIREPNNGVGPTMETIKLGHCKCGNRFYPEGRGRI